MRTYEGLLIICGLTLMCAFLSEGVRVILVRAQAGIFYSRFYVTIKLVLLFAVRGWGRRWISFISISSCTNLIVLRSIAEAIRLFFKIPPIFSWIRHCSHSYFYTFGTRQELSFWPYTHYDLCIRLSPLADRIW